MSVGAVIQARMTSQRLPGKVLRCVAGKPLLQYLAERVRLCHGLGALVIATSSDPSDDPVEEFCTRQGLPCHRGPLLDVARRFRDVLDVYAWDAFVRLNGDSPLLDQCLVGRALGLYRQTTPDLVTNVLPRTFPRGQSVEVVRAATFRQVYDRMSRPDEFEHVTRFFYKNPGDFRIVNFASDRDLSDVHLSVDTPEDLETFAGLVARMSRPHWQYGLDDLLRLSGQMTGHAPDGGRTCRA